MHFYDLNVASEVNSNHYIRVCGDSYYIEKEYKVNLSEYLHQELQYRLEVSRNNQSSGKNFKQYYIIV